MAEREPHVLTDGTTFHWCPSSIQHPRLGTIHCASFVGHQGQHRNGTSEWEDNRFQFVDGNQRNHIVVASSDSRALCGYTTGGWNHPADPHLPVCQRCLPGFEKRQRSHIDKKKVRR